MAASVEIFILALADHQKRILRLRELTPDVRDIPHFDGFAREVFVDPDVVRKRELLRQEEEYELAQIVGEHPQEGGIQAFFRLRASRLGTDPVVAYDSTTISTYSENLHEARQGFNKDGDGLDTIKLLTLYSVKDRDPVAFAKEPGNVPDVISIGNAITQLEALGIARPLVVTDNGYTSEANMAEFVRRGQKFLTLVDTDVKWVRDAVDMLQDELDAAEGVCPFDTDICGATLMTDHEFTRTRMRSRGGSPSGGRGAIVVAAPDF